MFAQHYGRSPVGREVDIIDVTLDNMTDGFEEDSRGGYSIGTNYTWEGSGERGTHTAFARVHLQAGAADAPNPAQQQRTPGPSASTKLAPNEQNKAFDDAGRRNSAAEELAYAVFMVVKGRMSATDDKIMRQRYTDEKWARVGVLHVADGSKTLDNNTQINLQHNIRATSKVQKKPKVIDTTFHTRPAFKRPIHSDKRGMILPSYHDRYNDAIPGFYPGDGGISLAGVWDADEV